MTEDQFARELAEAQCARDREVEKLQDLSDDQLDYLARVDELDDPITDGVECDADTRADSY